MSLTDEIGSGVKDAIGLFLIVLIIVEFITFLISFMIPYFSILNAMKNNSNPSQIVDVMQLIANFLIAQVIAIPSTILVTFLTKAYQGLNRRGY